MDFCSFPPLRVASATAREDEGAAAGAEKESSTTAGSLGCEKSSDALRSCAMTEEQRGAGTRRATTDSFLSNKDLSIVEEEEATAGGDGVAWDCGCNDGAAAAAVAAGRSSAAAILRSAAGSSSRLSMSTASPCRSDSRLTSNTRPTSRVFSLQQLRSRVRAAGGPGPGSWCPGVRQRATQPPHFDLGEETVSCSRSVTSPASLTSVPGLVCCLHSLPRLLTDSIGNGDGQ